VHSARKVLLIVTLSDPNDQDKGLPGFARVFRAVKGPDRVPTAGEFTPTASKKPDTEQDRASISARRVGRLFVIVWIIFMVASFVLYVGLSLYSSF
jgi:hypothetical protein